MQNSRNQYNENERIHATMMSGAAFVTGSTSVILQIQREYDGYYFDFGTSSFKASGWTSSGQAMTELDSTGSAGVYYYDWNVSNIGTQASQRNYFFRATCAAADNTPQEGELKLGGWIDNVNALGGVIQGGGSGMSLNQIKKFAEEVWKVTLKGGESAEEVLLTRSQFDAAKDIVKTGKDEDMEKLINKVMNDNSLERHGKHKELLDVVASLKPYNYSKIIQDISDKVKALDKAIIRKEDVPDFTEVLSTTNKNLNNISEEFMIIKEEIGIFTDKMNEQIDIEKRLERASNKNVVVELVDKLATTRTEILEQIRNLKLDIVNSKFSAVEDVVIDLDRINSKLDLLLR